MTHALVLLQIRPVPQIPGAALMSVAVNIASSALLLREVRLEGRGELCGPVLYLESKWLAFAGSLCGAIVLSFAGLLAWSLCAPNGQDGAELFGSLYVGSVA